MKMTSKTVSVQQNQANIKEEVIFSK